jgi:hypothetical protein
MDDEALFDRALYFTQLEQAGNLVPRALEDVQKILGRLVFELSMREQTESSAE